MADMQDMNSINKNGSTPSDLASELERLRNEAKQLADENKQLKDKLEDLQTERDDFLRALRYYAPGEIFTAEDLAEFRKNAISGQQMLQIIDDMMREVQ